MTGSDRIEINKNVRGGKPVVKGTAVKVMSILSEWERGLSVEEIIATHPELTEEDIHAAVAYARNELAKHHGRTHLGKA
jgi:uncharacterized protein (DUF433 family)